MEGAYLRLGIRFPEDSFERFHVGVLKRLCSQRGISTPEVPDEISGMELLLMGVWKILVVE
jgi:hypothetical protein